MVQNNLNIKMDYTFFHKVIKQYMNRSTYINMVTIYPKAVSLQYRSLVSGERLEY